MSKVSGLSVAALIFGIISLFICWLPLLGLLFVICTLSISFISLKKIKNNKKEGQGMAIAGIVMGFLSLIPAVVMTIALFGMASLINEEPSYERTQINSSCVSEVKNILGNEILLEYNLNENIRQNQNCLTRFPNAKFNLTECSRPKEGHITVYPWSGNPLRLGANAGENPNYLYGNLEFNVAYSSKIILDENGLIKGRNTFRTKIIIENIEDYYPDYVDIQYDRHIFHINPIKNITFMECNMTY